LTAACFVTEKVTGQVVTYISGQIVTLSQHVPKVFVFTSDYPQ